LKSASFLLQLINCKLAMARIKSFLEFVIVRLLVLFGFQ
jgi:hypothetical protein